MATDAQKRAVRKYEAANVRQFNLRLNVRTDADIIAKLDSVESKQGYVKSLIRRDIEGSR